MEDYDLRCPDCNIDGGNGVRCLKHQSEWLDHEIDRLLREKAETDKLLRLDNEHS